MKSLYLIPFVLLLISSAIGLAITLRYDYIPNLSLYRTDTCKLNSCYGQVWTECYGCGVRGGTCCNTYTSNDVNFTLDLNGTLYNKVIRYKRFDCSPSTETCYYMDNNIYDSLSLQPLPLPQSLTGVVLLSLFMFMMVTCIVYVSVCWLTTSLNEKITTDDEL